MKSMLKSASIDFSAGCLGAVTNSLAVWIFGVLGITQALGVKIAPTLTPAWLYPRLVWGGIWGLLFLLPLVEKRIFLRGIVLSLGQTIAQLLMVFPFKSAEGMMGLDLGSLTPLFVIFYDAV